MAGPDKTFGYLIVAILGVVNSTLSLASYHHHAIIISIFIWSRNLNLLRSVPDTVLFPDWTSVGLLEARAISPEVYYLYTVRGKAVVITFYFCSGNIEGFLNLEP